MSFFPSTPNLSLFFSTAKSDGRSCEFNSRMYQSGETFQPNCKYQCTCMDGSVGCVSLCTRDLLMYKVGCAKPKRVKIKGQCCKQLICLKSASTGRSVSRTHRRKYNKDRSKDDFSNKNGSVHVWRGKLTGKHLFSLFFLVTLFKVLDNETHLPKILNFSFQ
ncbi:hypothetical protein AMECASPLE_032092 [Ameca splendens]|uniref:VWFC domain-containing protein n=1 Tax=Ameca splendens TaxID=208324 RepID=A0ABV0ZSD8_9TELE